MALTDNERKWENRKTATASTSERKWKNRKTFSDRKTPFNINPMRTDKMETI